uniref:tRNA-intron lyase n=1 Tax=Prasinoderma coloniale TaxID=156133 RepID=A0A7R9TWK4_9VIRI|eukprot:PRCOL_00003701-RA
MLQVRRTASRVTSFKKVRLPGMPGGRVACADMGSPLDACHEELSAAPPLYATLIHTAVRMDVDVATRERLARGCLGKIVKGEGGDASAPAVGGGSAGGAVALPAAVVPTEPLQLSPEETFFMAHNLRCLRVTRLGDAAPMSSAELWRELVRLVPRFAYTYTAFVHFRAAGWMARPGLQFGADMVLYRRHPEYVHSDYAAIVLPPGKHEVPFLEMQAIGRMCEQVNKGVIYAYVSATEGFVGPAEQGVGVLEHLAVELVEVSRFLQEKHRNQSGPVRGETQADLDVALRRVDGFEMSEGELRRLLPPELFPKEEGDEGDEDGSDKGQNGQEGERATPEGGKKLKGEHPKRKSGEAAGGRVFFAKGTLPKKQRR